MPPGSHGQTDWVRSDVSIGHLDWLCRRLRLRRGLQDSAAGSLLSSRVCLFTNQTHAATPGGTHHGLVWDGRHPRRRGIPRGQGHVRGHVLPQLRRRAAGVQRGSRRHPTRAQERKGGAEPRGLLPYHCDREQGRRDDLERTAAGAVRQERPSRPEGDHRGASEALSLCKTSTGDADSVFPLLIL